MFSTAIEQKKRLKNAPEGEKVATTKWAFEKIHRQRLFLAFEIGILVEWCGYFKSMEKKVALSLFK